MSPSFLMANLVHRVVLILMLLQLAWFGFWVIGIDLTLTGWVDLSLPGVETPAIPQLALMHNVILGHVMVVCLIISTILHLYSHRSALPLYSLVVAMHLYFWIWFVYSSRYTSPIGFVVILVEALVITLLVMLRRGKFR